MLNNSKFSNGKQGVLVDTLSTKCNWEILKERKIWVCWKYENKVNKKSELEKTKVPYHPNNYKASSANPNTWSNYDQVKNAKGFDGIGTMFDGRIIGIDLDKVLVNGEIVVEEVKRLVESWTGYVEVSPSGTGLHLLAFLSEEFAPIKKSHTTDIKTASGQVKYENYTTGRFFTFTGKEWHSSAEIKTISKAEAESFLKIIGYSWDKKELEVTVPIANAEFVVENEIVLNKMLSIPKYNSFFNLDDSHKAEDTSGADMSFMCGLQHFTAGNQKQMKEIFLSTPRAKRDKVSVRKDYLNNLVRDSISKYPSKSYYDWEQFGEHKKLLVPKKIIDTTQFKEISLDDVSKILGLTIKNDDINKKINFLCQLSAFTEDNQFNVMFNSVSSSGKSYTALETSKLFPKESLLKLGHSSATAFFHETGKYDKERNTVVVDLSRKILIFTENQHYQLLEKLRGFLSHDEKVMVIKVTDKGQKGGHKTKTVELVGFASVIFCTANLKSDEQEKTRFIILSPEITDEKITAGIKKVIERETGNDEFQKLLASHPERRSLIERIQAIADAGINEILLLETDAKYLEKKFFDSLPSLQPRHQRDIKRLIDLAKAIALLNIWLRGLKDKTIIANRGDVDTAIELYSHISLSQNLGISPYLCNFYFQIIQPLFQNKNGSDFVVIEEEMVGISYQEIINFHRKTWGKKLDYNYLRQQILPELEGAGLIVKVTDGNSVKVFPTDLGSTNQSSERVGRVN